MSRYIDADKLIEMLRHNPDFLTAPKHSKDGIIDEIVYQPTADVVEVRHDFNVGDFCLYGYVDGNQSLAIVEIIKILDDARGIAELKFHKVIKDNTGNGFFHYLFKNGKTMNGSFKYLKNITPCVNGERKEQ